MERVLNIRRPRRAAPAAAGSPAESVAILAPGAAAGEWELSRPATKGSPAGTELSLVVAAAAATRQIFPSLEAAAANLVDAERFVLALPLDMGLIQRLSLPPAEPDELEEMVRIQLEKILPYPAESVSLAIQEIARTDAEVVVAVETVHYDRLIALCQPLVSRDGWPLRVTFHVRALAADAPAGETTAFLCREWGKTVLGVCEGGRLSFAQAVTGETAEDLAAELPAVLLGAELDGVPTGFSVLRLDRRAEEWRGVLEAALNVPVELFDAGEAAAGAVAATPARGEADDLSPAHWRAERLRGERMARLRRRLVLGVGIYFALLALAFLGAGVLWARLHWQRAQLEKLHGPSRYSQDSQTHWNTLAPAVEPSRYLVETVWQVYECLPADSSVLLTTFDQTPRGIAVQGEAPSPSAAVDFTDKLKASPGLRMYRFEADPPAPLANGHARFHVAGTLPDAAR